MSMILCVFIGNSKVYTHLYLRKYIQRNCLHFENGKLCGTNYRKWSLSVAVVVIEDGEKSRCFHDEQKMLQHIDI